MLWFLSGGGTLFFLVLDSMCSRFIWSPLFACVIMRSAAAVPKPTFEVIAYPPQFLECPTFILIGPPPRYCRGDIRLETTDIVGKV